MYWHGSWHIGSANNEQILTRRTIPAVSFGVAGARTAGGLT
jgi:hypothetical protein